MIGSVKFVTAARRAVCAAVAAASLIFFSGCSGDAQTSIDRLAYPTANGTMADREVLEKLADSGHITIYSFDSGSTGVTAPDADWYKNFLDYFKKMYGGTVTALQMEWQGWEDRFIADYASGTAPDLIHLFEKNFPLLVNRGQVLSTDDLKDRGVVGLDHPILANKLDLVSRLYTYNGESYAFACNMAEADMIFVNEDLFDRYGVTSPTDYYSRGLWNQTNFEKCANEIARDLNGDGNNDIYGFYCWDPYCFVAAAGGQLVSLDDDGALRVSIDDSTTVKGLNNFYQLYGRQRSATLTSSWYFGRTAMVSWLPRNEYHNLENGMLDFNWSVIPFPLDSENKDNVRPGKCYGWAVTESSLNPQGCVNYCIALNSYSVINSDPAEPNYSKYFGPEQLQMFADCVDNIQSPIHAGVGDLDDIQWDMWGALAAGRSTVDEVIDLYSKRFEQQVRAENNASK